MKELLVVSWSILTRAVC